jgi:oligopeptidase B
LETAATWQHDPSVEQAAGSPTKPPEAARRPAVLERHGDRRLDPYYWLRQRANPEVIAYLAAENDYAEFVMEPTRDLQERLYEEIVGRVQQSDTSAPSFFKGSWHYTRTVEGQDYEIHCRRRGSMEAPEEIELDGNVLAAGHDYFDLGFVERSPDENLIAYATDFSGNELHQLRIRDLRTGEDLDDVVENVYYGFAWAADNRTFFYVRPDEAMRP